MEDKTKEKIVEAIELLSQLRMCLKEMQKEHNDCKAFIPSKEIAIKFNLDRFGDLNTLLSMFEYSIKK